MKTQPFLSDDCSRQQDLKPDWQQRSHSSLAKGSEKLSRQMEMIQNKDKKNFKNNAFFSAYQT